METLNSVENSKPSDQNSDNETAAVSGHPDNPKPSNGMNSLTNLYRRPPKEIPPDAPKAPIAPPFMSVGQQVLSGSLVAFSPSSLLSLLNMQKHTGWLRMRNQPFEGYIYVDKGEVFDAGIWRVSHGALAIFQLFGWREGEFRFETGSPPPERRTIEASLPVLQVRATLWLDSMKKYTPIIPSPSHRISIAAEPRREVIIEPYQWAVLTKIVTKPCSVAELAAELGQDLMTVTKISAELVKMEVAMVLPPEFA